MKLSDCWWAGVKWKTSVPRTGHYRFSKIILLWDEKITKSQRSSTFFPGHFQIFSVFLKLLRYESVSTCLFEAVATTALDHKCCPEFYFLAGVLSRCHHYATSCMAVGTGLCTPCLGALCVQDCALSRTGTKWRADGSSEQEAGPTRRITGVLPSFRSLPEFLTKRYTSHLYNKPPLGKLSIGM